MVTFDSKKYSKKLLHLISWSHWFTLFNIAAAILLSSLYFFNESSPDSIFSFIYLIATWFSHMAFLTFMSLVLIVFPITLLFPNTRFIRPFASFIFTLGLLLLVLDAFIYTRLGYHLNASSSSQIVNLIASEIEENNQLFGFISLVLFMAILTFELVISNFAWKHLKQLQRTTFARPIIFSFVAAFFFSHITHIWADASLDYDILRQDTVLPLSYPLTAKTLLTKYQLFDREDYIERRTSPLSFTADIPPYPVLNDQMCQPQIKQKNSVFIILSSDLLSKQQQEQFIARAHSTSIELNHHIDSALNDDAWFNLFYSLPTIYQENILQQQSKPLLFQAADKLKLATSFTIIGNQDKNNDSPYWFEALFEQKNELADISSLIFADKLNSIEPGIHLIYFPKDNQYQFELFMDALLLAQKQKENQDIVWVSSIGNKTFDTALSIKPALLILPNSKSISINELTSHMDLQPTLMSNWLGCTIKPVEQSAYKNGADLLTLNKDRVIANTVKSGIMVFNKDKSVFIDQNGNFQSYSRQLEAPIVEKSDFPLMIDGVHFIKAFGQKPKAAQ
jgi:membrane-anchored protein YejM (alkaline phosphatase superfamily)